MKRLEPRNLFRRPRNCIAILLLTAMAGCQQLKLRDEPTPPAPGSALARMQREQFMNRQWRNRPFAALVAAFGEPVLTMEIPGGGNPPGFAAIYELEPTSGCIDAFAIVSGLNPMISNYHCR